MIDHAPAAVAARADGGSMPRRTHVLAGVLFGAGLFGLWGGLPVPWGLGLGALAVAVSCLIVATAQQRHHPRSRIGFRATPRSLLNAWVGGGPVLFMMVLPDDVGPAVLIPLAALFATLFYATFRLEDAACTARERTATSTDR